MALADVSAIGSPSLSGKVDQSISGVVRVTIVSSFVPVVALSPERMDEQSS